MRINKKVARGFLAVIVPMGMVTSIALIGGTASAKKAPAESIHCTSITATINFSPALVPSTSSAGYSKTLSTTISNETITGCAGTPNASAVTAATSASATIAPGKSGNTCTGFAAAAAKAKESFNTTWNNGGGSSVASFKGSTVTTSPPGFSLSKGKVTGAFASKAGTVSVSLDGPSTTKFAACEGGSGTVSSLTISSGSATL